MSKEIKTKILNNNSRIEILKTKHLDLKTKIIDFNKKRQYNQKDKIANLLIPTRLRGGEIKEIEIDAKKMLDIVSYVDNKKREIFLKKLINTGSYNQIYAFSRKKTDKIDPNLIIRISNQKSTVENINTELKGIKTQYNLCNGLNNIGNIVDYGMIYNPSKSGQYRLQEYSIIQKYGIDYKRFLENTPKYKNIGVVLHFMKNLLKDIAYIHNENIAHLDLKPSNILLSFKSIPKNQIEKVNYAIVDFGAARKFTNESSKIIDGQMASAAFSPPELLQRKFGKKSDIWAYGIICYLSLVRKFFFKAKGQQIFMGSNKKEVERNITKAIDNLISKIKPRYIKNSVEFRDYLKPLTIDNFYLLEDFLRKIFTIKESNRPNARELFKHDIFNLL